MSITNRLNETQDEDNLEPLPDVDTYLSKVLFRGRSLAAQGDWPEAEATYKQAIAHMRDAHGPDHIDVQVLYVELADLLAAHGNPEEAEACHTLALNAVEKTKGHDHPNMVFRLNALAKFLTAQGRHGEASSVLRRWNEIPYDRSHAMCEPMLMATLCDLKIAAGRFDEAEQCARHELSTWVPVVGERHPYIARTQAKIGRLCAKQGKYDEAAQLFLYAAKANRECHGNGHEETMNALQLIRDLLAIPNACSDAETLKVITDEWLTKEAAAAKRNSGRAVFNPDVEEAMMTPAGMLGSKVGREIVEDTEGREGLFQALTKRYAKLLDTADGRSKVRSRMGELLSVMAFCWAEGLWEKFKVEREWLEDVEQRRDFKKAVSSAYYLVAFNEASKWLDAMSVRESALNPSAS